MPPSAYPLRLATVVVAVVALTTAGIAWLAPTVPNGPTPTVVYHYSGVVVNQAGSGPCEGVCEVLTFQMNATVPRLYLLSFAVGVNRTCESGCQTTVSSLLGGGSAGAWRISFPFNGTGSGSGVFPSGSIRVEFDFPNYVPALPAMQLTLEVTSLGAVGTSTVADVGLR